VNLALFLVAALGAESTNLLFSLETASPVVWIATADKPQPFEGKGFFRIRCNGQPPADGVFQVNGWPVQPAIEWIGRSARHGRQEPPVVVGENTYGAFDLRIREPGRYTFRAKVGKAWSAQVTIEAKPMPFELGMPKPAFLEKYGNPDATKADGRLIYRRWTGLVVYERPGSGMQADQVPAEAWQAALLATAAADGANSAKDLAILPGTWDVKVGDGYHGTWDFRADGTVLKDGRSPGVWVATPDQIKIIWTDDGAWESFSRPLSAKRVTGNSVRGAGLVLGVKVIP
jgi:hypothetical protein